MKQRLALSLALLAALTLGVSAQECQAKKEGSCSKVTLTATQDGGSACAAKTGSGCETLDLYLATEKAAAKGCKKSQARLAKLDQDNTELAAIAKLYKAACNGCETSQTKLAALKDAKLASQKSESACTGEAKLTATQDCASACTGEAKLAATQDCASACDETKVAKTGSGCDKLDGYLALEKAAANGCCESKTKLAKLQESDTELVKIAGLYKAAGNGCEASKAKLAELESTKLATQKSCESACTGEAKLATVKDCASSCDGDAKLAATQDCASACDGTKVAKTGSGCDKLDGYLALEKAAANGCCESKTKLAKLQETDTELVKVAGLYKAACNGCEASKAKLAELESTKLATQKSCESACTGEAKLATVKDCASDSTTVALTKVCGGQVSTGCEKLDGYLALEKAAASGCCESKTKLAKLQESDTELVKVAGLYKAACNGCEASKAKLAELKSTKLASQKSCESACTGEAKLAAKQDCGSSCAGEAKLAAKQDCGSSCAGEAKLAAKKDCCSGAEGCCEKAAKPAPKKSGTEL